MEMNNIVKISVARCDEIGVVVRRSENSVEIVSPFVFSEINCFKKPATLVSEEKTDDSGRIYQTKLTFLVRGRRLPDMKRHVFLCETLSGDRVLVGSDKRPYPIVSQSENHPGNYTDSQLTTVTVEYSSCFPLSYII